MTARIYEITRFSRRFDHDVAGGEPRDEVALDGARENFGVVTGWGEAPRALVVDREQPVEQVPAEIAVTDFVAQDPIERDACDGLGARFAQMAKQRHGDG